MLRQPTPSPGAAGRTRPPPLCHTLFHLLTCFFQFSRRGGVGYYGQCQTYNAPRRRPCALLCACAPPPPLQFAST